MKEPYNLIQSNCAQAVQYGLEQGGVDLGRTINLNWSGFGINGDSDFNSPHAAFDRIMKNNPGGQLLKMK
ncbi:MAG: hypothetical protein LBQ22_04885 [Bacteroidales bacterium]|jgi:hypothetical protein|nr:hypothetical protein [Bacteroidales bacterium]